MATESRDVFISHDSIEAPVAELFRQAIIDTGHRAFVSGRDIMDAPWETTIADALSRATHGIVLVSPRSLQSRWVWMELAAIRFKLGRVIPVVLPGLDSNALPEEIRRFQVRQIATPSDVDGILRLVDEHHAVDCTILHQKLMSAVDWRAVRPGPPLAAPQGHGFLVDASHSQGRWPLPWARAWSFFDRFGGALDAIAGEPIDVRPFAAREHLYRGHLSDWSGLVVVAPWRSALSADIIEEIEQWVRKGGRLLLCGYEYGDLHHNSNLNALASRFGIRFRSDIVHPGLPEPPAPGSELKKPFGVEIVVSKFGDDTLLEDVEQVSLMNAQSIDVEPGGKSLLSTNQLVVCQPHPDDVVYEAGVFTTRGDRCVTIGAAAWLSVMARAPKPLCGQGEVVAMGTWILRPRVEVNDPFIKNLLLWLTGR